nr:MAG: putative ATP-dependent endonuclease of the OLD family [Candidatus Kentron sp. FM]VFJ48660.1 MAG: putative ATP-dependent endonuclease of the OLD family [Candidatus Kentron sp. FM]
MNSDAVRPGGLTSILQGFPEFGCGQAALWISMVGIGGKGNYLPFARLAESFSIPWFIFSDGEPKTIEELKNFLGKLGKSKKLEEYYNIFVIPNGKDFEGYIATADYEDTLIDAIIETNAKSGQHKEVLREEWDSKSDKLDAISKELDKNKTRYARPIAEAITKLDDEALRSPPCIRQLFDAMSSQLGLTKQETSAP